MFFIQILNLQENPFFLLDVETLDHETDDIGDYLQDDNDEDTYLQKGPDDMLDGEYIADEQGLIHKDNGMLGSKSLTIIINSHLLLLQPFKIKKKIMLKTSGHDTLFVKTRRKYMATVVYNTMYVSK